ncbi:MAG: DinB family protein [Microbacteriaceae bacterium]
MPIIPDTKDWTWVLERPCPECGFDARSIEATGVAGILRANAAAWPDVLRRSGVRERPDDATWSPLEYAAHVRDVLRLGRYRLGLMLEHDDPLFPDWDQDATARDDDYAAQEPAAVAEQLLAAAAEITAALETVPSTGWARPGRRGDGARFTLGSFAVYLSHDPVHHLWDVTKG